MDLLRRAWRAEPVAILTITGIVVQAVLDANAGGWDLATAFDAAIVALAGLITRSTVTSPRTAAALTAELSD